MKTICRHLQGGVATFCLVAVVHPCASADVIFEQATAHHHIQVIDDGHIRTLSFNRSQETRMSLRDSLQGHFEYTEYFHMPWLWNTNMTNILMIGLGGGSTQRSYLHYYPWVKVDTVELDPVVVRVAEDYFHLPRTTRHRVFIEDGRQYLRRSKKEYDVIILDAYRTTRYGSYMPYHLVTKEFFQIVRDRLSTNGVVALNVMGTESGWRADILGATYRTMDTVFPRVYQFPAKDSLNVVLLATKSDRELSSRELRKIAVDFSTIRLTIPTIRDRAASVKGSPPRTAARSPVLTDDFAPVDGLLSTVGR